MRLTHALCASLLVALPVLAACSSSSNKGSGGAGGSTTGGTAGSSTGGTSGGGTSSGGTAGTTQGGAGGEATGGTAGTATGGTAGAATGGTAGAATGGTAGAATGGTAGAATGGTAGAGGGGTTESCPGCIRISTVMAKANDSATAIYVPAATVDLTDATLTFHVMVKSGTGGGVQPFVQNVGGSYPGCGWTWTNLSAISGWQDVTLTINTTNCTATGFDMTKVGQFGLTVNAGATGPWTNPSVVYVDSVTVKKGTTDVVGPFTFDTTLQSWALGYEATPSGSTVTWQGP